MLKIRPNACHYLKNLGKFGLRQKFGLRTESDYSRNFGTFLHSINRYSVDEKMNRVYQIVVCLQMVCQGIWHLL